MQDAAPDALVGDLVGLLDRSPEAVSDASLQRLISAVVRVYAHRAEAWAEEGGDFPPPVLPELVNATEAVSMVSEMIRAVNLNLFDLMLWHNRRG